MNTTLSEIQETMLAFSVQHQETHGRPPSLQEICEEFGFANYRSARRHLLALTRKGMVAQTGDGRTWAAKVTEVQGYFFTTSADRADPAETADRP